MKKDSFLDNVSNVQSVAWLKLAGSSESTWPSSCSSRDTQSHPECASTMSRGFRRPPRRRPRLLMGIPLKDAFWGPYISEPALPSAPGPCPIVGELYSCPKGERWPAALNSLRKLRNLRRVPLDSSGISQSHVQGRFV